MSARQLGVDMLFLLVKTCISASDKTLIIPTIAYSSEKWFVARQFEVDVDVAKN